VASLSAVLVSGNREKITTLPRCSGEDANAGERRSGVKKKSDRNRWVMHVPVLSTSHIKQETLNNLGPEFQVLSMNEGAFVWIGTEAYASANTPEELKPVIRWMNSAYPKEWWVRFDRDGATLSQNYPSLSGSCDIGGLSPIRAVISGLSAGDRVRNDIITKESSWKYTFSNGNFTTTGSSCRILRQQ
jgi:hypothetical protein